MDNANLVGPASPLLTSFTFDDLSLRRSANLLVPTATSLTVATTSSSGGILTNQGTYTPSSSTIVGMEVVNSGALVLPNNDATLAGSGTLTVANNDLTIHSMVIQSGGRLSHVANAAAQTNVLRLTASSLQLDYGGAITVDGKGFAGQSGPGAGAYEATAGTGAGHGGPGGASQTSSTVGPAYDDPDSPIFVGSGGGNSSCGGTDGGAGGGLANLNVLGTLTLNGNITANGLSGTCRGGGGAGGTVFITAGVLAGVTGTLHADGGGVADGRAGTGGGGRVKLVYTTDSFTGGVANLVRTANGGTGGFANGTAGSVK
jgi:hypothetical protein